MERVNFKGHSYRRQEGHNCSTIYPRRHALSVIMKRDSKGRQFGYGAPRAARSTGPTVENGCQGYTVESIIGPAMCVTGSKGSGQDHLWRKRAKFETGRNVAKNESRHQEHQDSKSEGADLNERSL